MAKYVLMGIFLFFSLMSMGYVFAGVIVSPEYITVYPGEEGHLEIDLENNEKFDIEDVSLTLVLDEVPFSVRGSLEETVDDINDGKDDVIDFTLRATSNAAPGDYTIPYVITYLNEEDSDESFEKEGAFNIRVSARTELDFIVDISEDSLVGEEGQVALEIVNLGLGEIKSLSVQIFPEGFEVLGKDKVFVGTIDSDDTDLATFDVIFTSGSPLIRAEVSYKDFENVEQTQQIALPSTVFTREEALEKGIIQQSNTSIYLIILVVLFLVWFMIRRSRKRRKKNNKL